jgi:hypothetical protein
VNWLTRLRLSRFKASPGFGPNVIPLRRKVVKRRGLPESRLLIARVVLAVVVIAALIYLVRYP